MVEVRIGYFLEDIGQERFLGAIVERLVHEVRLPPVQHDIRNATGGKGQTLSELKRFFRDVEREQERPFDILIVAIDGNCYGYNERRSHIERLAEQTGYPGVVVCAIPDPHIEYWYMADANGFANAVGMDVEPEVPPYKCERGRYKKALLDALEKAGIHSYLGGSEYGEVIAARVDLYRVGSVDPAFGHFARDLRAELTYLSHVIGGQSCS